MEQYSKEIWSDNVVMYDDKCVNWMCNRQKSEIRRLYNPNRRPGIPGAIHWIKKDRTPKVYGQYLVLSCKPQRFGDLTDEDAQHEGNFKNAQEYKEYFYSVNGHIEDDDLVWVMKFLIIWTNPEGTVHTEKEKKEFTDKIKNKMKGSFIKDCVKISTNSKKCDHCKKCLLLKCQDCFFHIEGRCQYSSNSYMCFFVHKFGRN